MAAASFGVLSATCWSRWSLKFAPTRGQHGPTHTRLALPVRLSRVPSARPSPPRIQPVFGQIKHAPGFRQFLMRDLERISGEWARGLANYEDTLLEKLMPRRSFRAHIR
jgi:hypothetical protein